MVNVVNILGNFSGVRILDVCWDIQVIFKYLYSDNRDSFEKKQWLI